MSNEMNLQRALEQLKQEIDTEILRLNQLKTDQQTIESKIQRNKDEIKMKEGEIRNDESKLNKIKEEIKNAERKKGAQSAELQKAKIDLENALRNK